MMPRQPDRRQAPRREEDAALHYAIQNLLATALACDEANAVGMPTAGVLHAAAENYRVAELAARPEVVA